MREILNRNASRWARELERYLTNRWRGVYRFHSDIVSDCFYIALRRLDAIEIAWTKIDDRERGGISKERYLRACVFRLADWRAKAIINSPRYKRTTFLEQEIENRDGRYARPRVVVHPEQEEVVFLKQILEHCGALDPVDAAIMRATADRATTQEIVDELAIPTSELLARRASAFRKLMEAVPS